jgi:hypothetical protein
MAGGWRHPNEERPMTATTTQSLLATPAQLDAERALLQLLEDPDVKALQAQLRAELAATPTGQLPDGAAEIDYAVAEYTNALIYAEIATYQATPAFIWGVDNTTRVRTGLSVGGAGMAGDNPDFIYRRITIDGNGLYEVNGRFDLACRPAELSMEAMRGDIGPMMLQNQSRSHADMGNHIGVITDRDIMIEEDGSFRIIFGGPPGPGVLPTEPGEVTVMVRDVLSDWSQRPSQLSIRRVDSGTPLEEPADLKQRVLAKLGPFVHFWSSFHVTWLGGLAPNSYGGPAPRDGGWGFVLGARFKVGADEALLLKTRAAGAGYHGFQLSDLWMISPNARRHQASLNLSQMTADADGDYTFLVTPTDPGIANWVDSAGLHEGTLILRWQIMPPGVSKDELVRDFRVIKLADAPGLAGVARVTPEERKARLAARDAAYGARTTI